MPSAQGHITVRRRAKDGTPGSDAVRYWVIPSATQIKRAQDGTMYPNTVTCEKRKQTGNASPVVTTEGTLYYQVGYPDGSHTSKNAYSSGVNATSGMAWIKFILEVSQVEVASETVSVVRDGDDVYLLDLDNEMQGIPCNSSGTPTISGTIASTNATVYKGAKVDSGWTFSKEDSDCTSSINKTTGAVSVSAISADKASVTVKATKDAITLTAVLSLYKVKAGANGSSPVIYSIEVSANAISRSQTDSLTPSSITAYKNKTVGSTTARTSEMVLKFKRIGQDSSELTLSGTGGTINNISSACTSIQIKIYTADGSTVLDSETVPIVKDGTDGIDGSDAVRYWLVPSVTQVTKASDGTLSASSVSCYVMKQVGSSAPVKTTDLFVTYRVITTNAPLQLPSLYTPENGITISNTTRQVVFKLYMSGSSTQLGSATGHGECLDTATISVVFDGKPGDPGQQGIQGCIYRRSKFGTGFEYHNDSELKNDGIRYIDLVYIMKDSTMFASHALWFRCKKTHTSNADNAPQKSNNGTEAWLEYWEPLNTLQPIYTPLLLADDAIITLMQSNQILIANDEGVITAGMSGSIAGSKIRIWAGSQTPDNAPFRVDVLGKLYSSDADIEGKITATSGKIAGFNISGTSLTNGPEFSNDACVIFRNDEHNTFAGIGGNVLPAPTAMRAVARFENCDSNNFWGIGRNIAMLLSAKNGDINHAFLGSGNGNLDGWIGGYRYSKYTINASDTIYDGYLKISQNNKWIVYAAGTSSGVVLPTLTEVRNALGIGTSTSFCIELTVAADLHSKDFTIYGRCQKKVNVNGSEQTPYYKGDYPTMTHWNNGRYDSIDLGAGDCIVFLLVYDPNKSGVLNTSYSLMYTARIINRQN